MSIVLWAAVLWVYWRSQDLRPIADDYCWAAKSDLGLFDAVRHWYETWTGDITNVVAVTLIVGFPLGTLPMGLASSVPFAITSIILAMVASLVIAPPVPAWRRRVGLVAVVAPWVILSWWTYWWFSPATGSGAAVESRLGFLSGHLDEPTEDLARFVTVWQNVNVSYVILVCAVIAVAATLYRQRRVRGGVLAVLWLLAGLVAGLSGLITAAAVIAMTMSLYVVSLVISERDTRGYLARYGTVYIAGAATGFLISYFSPGTSTRAEGINSPFENSPVAAVTWAVSRSVKEVGLAFFVNGSLIVFLMGLVCAVLLTKHGWFWQPRELIRRALLLLLFGANLLFVTRLAEAQGGYAAHHAVPFHLTVFLAMFALGVATGAAVSVRWNPRLAPILLAAALLAPAWTLSTMYMVDRIESRSQVWARGPAPLNEIVDIETSWVNACWMDLGTQREIPNRE